MKRILTAAALALLCLLQAHAQTDSLSLMMRRLRKLEERIYRVETDPTFLGTMIRTPQDSLRDRITFSGYIDLYYALYTDSTGLAYQKFPTESPRDNAIGINLIQIGVHYETDRVRTTATFHTGDVAVSAWSPIYNYIQEANAGIRIAKRLWFDAGLFRTHIGLESIQPRENITTTIAVPTYYEPYYLSGAKLTWSLRDNLHLQANVFNDFNSFVETNKAKSIGYSINWKPWETVSLTLNSLYGNEAADTARYTSMRLYHNFFGTWQGKQVDIGAEANYGTQPNTYYGDHLHNAWMYSGLLSMRWRMSKQWAIYGRGDYFYDPYEMLTGPVENSYHELVGLECWGATAGLEFRPQKGTFFRLEGRRIENLRDNEDIFYWDGAYRPYRYELQLNMGAWF